MRTHNDQLADIVPHDGKPNLFMLWAAAVSRLNFALFLTINPDQGVQRALAEHTARTLCDWDPEQLAEYKRHSEGTAAEERNVSSLHGVSDALVASEQRVCIKCSKTVHAFHVCECVSVSV